MADKKIAFQMRVVPEWLATIDKWRGSQKPIPSRAEAIRQLVAAALSKPKKAA